MPNGINTISPSIRDFLLNKNLILTDTITENGLAGLAQGLGYPASITNGVNTVLPSSDLEEIGQQYRDLNVINNPYKSVDGYQEFEVNTNTVVNIGNLPVGGSPVGYSSFVYASNVENSLFNQSADEARKQLLKNYYGDPSQQIKVNLDNIPLNVEKQKKGYLDDKGNLNTGGLVSTKIVDVIGSILTGEGGAFTPNGFESNFDIRGTLAGRVLGATGVIGETPLGIIAGQQLGLHVSYNAQFGLQQETIGSINTNPLSLLQGNDFIVPDYSITVPSGEQGRVFDYIGKVLNIGSPVSLYERNSSIFQDENNISNIERANAQIKNTGKGQILALFDNILANESNGLLKRRYRPAFEDERVSKGANRTNQIFPDLYVGDPSGEGKVIDLLNPKKEDGNPTYLSETALNPSIFSNEFEGLGTINPTPLNEFDEIGTSKFSWVADSPNNKTGNLPSTLHRFNVTKGLLYKTQQMFDTKKMRTMVSGKGDFIGLDDQFTFRNDEICNGVRGYMSKGSAVLSEAALESSLQDPNEIFCRTWTTYDRYNQVRDLQKHTGLNRYVGLRNRNTTELSVLDSNGFVKIAPYIDDPDELKKFMFSIENLAWSDTFDDLPICERGLGDPITGTKGRIMWFPPYGIQFTDNSSVNWDSTNFIGRGEPIYTYNNTERTGTLQFKIIIDYATYMNDLRDLGLATNERLASIAAGCTEIGEDLIPLFSPAEKDEIEAEQERLTPQPEVVERPPQTPPPEFSVYFPNDATFVTESYEDGMIDPLDFTVSEGYTFIGCQGPTVPISQQRADCKQVNSTDFGLNGPGQPIDFGEDGITDGWKDPNFIINMRKALNEKCKACKIEIYGAASSDGNASANQKLSNDRADRIVTYFKSQILNSPEDPKLTEDYQASRIIKIIGQGAIDVQSCPPFKNSKGVIINPDYPVDAECKKKARRVLVKFKYDPVLEEKLNPTPPPKEPEPVINNQNRELAAKIKRRFFSECTYFEKLAEDAPIVYNTIAEKIRYFHPAFHSMTPEGFNARLTFLKQCTRQGPTLGADKPNNMAFGKAPVCILRVGDFYYTKIVIDNVQFSFDPLVWDLNPEGVGVQPMICNVDLSFKIIGGSSLNGPINKLQNALSFNFFANTEMYDPRADYIEIQTPKDIGKAGQGWGKYVRGTKVLAEERVDEYLLTRQEDERKAAEKSEEERAAQEAAKQQEENTSVSDEKVFTSEDKRLEIIKDPKLKGTEIYVNFDNNNLLLKLKVGTKNSLASTDIGYTLKVSVTINDGVDVLLAYETKVSAGITSAYLGTREFDRLNRPNPSEFIGSKGKVTIDFIPDSGESYKKSVYIPITKDAR